MHFAAADLHKWRSVDCRNHWIVSEPQDPWSSRWGLHGREHEAAHGVMLQTSVLKTLQIQINSRVTAALTASRENTVI